jgi:hypothetical protein
MYIITHPHRRRAPGLLSTSPHPQGLTGSLLGLITPYQKLPQVTLSARSGLGNSYSTAGTGTLTLGVPPATIVNSSQVKSFDFFDLKASVHCILPSGVCCFIESCDLSLDFLLKLRRTQNHKAKSMATVRRRGGAEAPRRRSGRKTASSPKRLGGLVVSTRDTIG